VEGGRTRDEVTDHLIELISSDPGLVVGLDFSFSLPSWFLKEKGLACAPELWDLASAEGEQWLADCEPPFWGRAGKGRPAEDPKRPQLRRTDVETARHAKLAARSPFQISGAGSVGASTVRGLPHLATLRSAGFRIWPWDDAEPPLIIEIWTRIAIGSTIKSNPQARADATGRDPRIPQRLKAAAAESEDSFDASTSAAWIADCCDSLIGLRRSKSQVDRLEGRTWIGSLNESPVHG
jgi:hypothetical protein